MAEEFRGLLRIRQQLTEEECLQILKTEKRGVLSVLGDNGYPYGMPMNHYYSRRTESCIFTAAGRATRSMRCAGARRRPSA